MNKLMYQIIGIGSIAMGGLGLFGNLVAPDVYSIFGCSIFLVDGVVIMSLLNKIK